jgi:hypothetical protein
MIQQILIGLVFLLAVGYVGTLVYKSFQSKKGCSVGCGKCSALDIEDMEKRISASGRPQVMPKL